MPTSTRVHIHLGVTDIARSRRFYATLLGADPVKEKPGYVKFLPEGIPVNLALSERGSASGASGPGSAAFRFSHVGIQVDSPAMVVAHLARVKGAGLPVREEFGVDCCHANQDKFWVVDPDGVQWEVYHLNYDLEDEMEDEPRHDPSHATPCCDTATDRLLGIV